MQDPQFFDTPPPEQDSGATDAKQEKLVSDPEEVSAPASDQKPDLSDLWNGLLLAICERMQPEQFATWFGRASLVGFDDDQLEIAVLNDFTQDWILKYHRPAIENAILAVLGSKRTLVISVNPELSSASIPNQVLSAVPTPEPAPQSPARPATASPESSPEPTRGGLLWNSDIELHPGYTFDNFVVGPCNRFGHAAAMGAAEQPGRSYNPFFLHGNVGVGKTHLLQGLCHMILERTPQSRILYLSCETFINHFISALQDGDTTRFRNKYRNVDVLVVDDIHLLANKERTQEEFFHTFNTLHDAQRQIVLSSDRPPDAIATLEDRLRSRFKMGLITDIQPPDFETRLAILRKKGDQAGSHVPPEVLEFIATNITYNIRELEGALIRVNAYASLNNTQLTVPLTQEILADILNATKPRQITPAVILDATAEQFGLEIAQLQGKSRTRDLVHARQVGMYVCRELTDLSYPQIGKQFGGRDHTTVIYAYEKVSNLMKERRKTYEDVTTLVQTLLSGG